MLWVWVDIRASRSPLFLKNPGGPELSHKVSRCRFYPESVAHHPPFFLYQFSSFSLFFCLPITSFIPQHRSYLFKTVSTLGEVAHPIIYFHSICVNHNSYYIAGASQVGLVVKNLPANVGDLRDVGSIPGLGRFPGSGHKNPLQYSCLENPMDRRAWRATVHRVAKSWTWLQWFSMAPHNLEIIRVVVWWLVITLQISSLKTWTLSYLPVNLRYLVTAQ